MPNSELQDYHFWESSAPGSDGEKLNLGVVKPKTAKLYKDAAGLVGLDGEILKQGEKLPSGREINKKENGFVLHRESPEQSTLFWTAVDSLKDVQPKD